MGRIIEDQDGGGEFNPTALLKEKGAMLKGVITGKRDVKTQYGAKPVYTFKVLDASCRFTLGKDKREVQPAEGDLVDAFATTRLARQLAQLSDGDTVTITYAGTKKMKRGAAAHTYKVEVE
jgi:hypothetical protein